MTWQAVARKDFADAIRSRSLWAVAGLFVVVTTGSSLLVTLLSVRSGSAAESIVGLTRLLKLLAGVLVPMTAVLVGYRAIVGERETGSIKLLLSLPHERRAVVLGKLVGRSLVVAVAVLAGFGLSTALAVVFAPSAFPVFVGVTVVTLLFAVAFVAIAVGLSAASGSARRAATGAFGAFVVSNILWQRIPGIYGAVTGSGGATPAWIYFIQRLSPSGAYNGAYTLFAGTRSLEAAIGGPVPPYLSWWAAVAILVGWVVLPTWLGYRRFERADL
jgi:ABC-2 type transport system permease protein